LSPWYIVAAGVAGVAIIVAAVVVYLGSGGSGQPKATPGALVTTFLPGEHSSVPSACGAIGAATLNQYVPGRRPPVAPQALEGKVDSECDWTVDNPPLFRLLEVKLRAMQPSGLAPGDGSATNAAIVTYNDSLQQHRNPPRSAGASKPQVTPVPGLGDAAFMVHSSYVRGGDTTNLVTVVVRKGNAVINVIFSGLDSSKRGGYGPASFSDLEAGAMAAVHDALTKVG
jgi:hypothetical protein